MWFWAADSVDKAKTNKKQNPYIVAYLKEQL